MSRAAVPVPAVRASVPADKVLHLGAAPPGCGTISPLPPGKAIWPALTDVAITGSLSHSPCPRRPGEGGAARKALGAGVGSSRSTSWGGLFPTLERGHMEEAAGGSLRQQGTASDHVLLLSQASLPRPRALTSGLPPSKMEWRPREAQLRVAAATLLGCHCLGAGDMHPAQREEH